MKVIARHDEAWHRRVDSWTAERNEQAEPAKPPWRAAEAEAILVYVDLHGCRFSADGVDASEAREAKALTLNEVKGNREAGKMETRRWPGKSCRQFTETTRDAQQARRRKS